MDNPRTQTTFEPEIGPGLEQAVQQWKEDCYRLSSLHCGSLLNKITSIKLVNSYKDAKGQEETYTVGQCQLHTYGFIIVKREVTIRSDLLKRPNTLRAVLAHEMGHCALLRAHVDDETHLMSPYILGEKALDDSLNSMLGKFYQDITAGTLPSIGAFDDE